MPWAFFLFVFLGLFLSCSDENKEKPSSFQKNSATSKDLIDKNIIADSIFTLSSGEKTVFFKQHIPLLDSVLCIPENPSLIKIHQNQIHAFKEGYTKIFCYHNEAAQEPFFFVRVVVNEKSDGENISSGKKKARSTSEKTRHKEIAQGPEQSPKKGSRLMVLSSPSYAQIFVDNVYWGTTPMLESKEIEEGQHLLMLIHRRYGQKDSLFQIGKSDSLQIKVNLKGE